MPVADKHNKEEFVMDYIISTEAFSTVAIFQISSSSLVFSLIFACAELWPDSCPAFAVRWGLTS